MIDGPRIAPRSGTAKQLVVFLHGYGADGNDLISLGREWQALLPDAGLVEHRVDFRKSFPHLAFAASRFSP